jgi:hypothetical protein
MDWSTEDAVNIQLTLKYDYAILQFWYEIRQNLNFNKNFVIIFYSYKRIPYIYLYKEFFYDKI